MKGHIFRYLMVYSLIQNIENYGNYDFLIDFFPLLFFEHGYLSYY